MIRREKLVSKLSLSIVVAAKLPTRQDKVSVAPASVADAFSFQFETPHIKAMSIMALFVSPPDVRRC